MNEINLKIDAQAKKIKKQISDFKIKVTNNRKVISNNLPKQNSNLMNKLFKNQMEIKSKIERIKLKLN